MRKAKAITFFEDDHVVAGFYITEHGLEFTIDDLETCNRIKISKESKLNDPEFFTGYCEEIEMKEYRAIAVKAHDEYSDLDCVIICGIDKDVASINVHIPSCNSALASCRFDRFCIEWELNDGRVVEGKSKILIQKKPKSTGKKVRRITDYGKN